MGSRLPIPSPLRGEGEGHRPISTSPIARIVTRRLVHQLVSQRLVERVYNQPLIGNVERGQYVECMIELALGEIRPPWTLTDTWSAWDLVQRDTGARIEVKQSAAFQTWTTDASVAPTPRFDIAPRTGYYPGDGDVWCAVDPPQRFADVYVMAWHSELDPDIADHRLPDQWEFYVLAADAFPEGQKGIGLNPLKELTGISSGCTYDELAQRVRDVLADFERDQLKVSILP